jgi:hypothetical protein
MGIAEILMWRRNKEGRENSDNSDIEEALRAAEGRIKHKDILRIKKLYDSGEVDEALKVARKVAAKEPIEAWEIFLNKAHEARDADEKAFWTVCASYATAVPLSFLPVDNWFKNLAYLAYGIAAGYVKVDYDKNREKGRKFLFKTNGEERWRTIAEVEAVVK